VVHLAPSCVSDSDMPGGDLLDGQLDRIRMSHQLRPVHRFVHRGPALQPFKGVAFGHLGAPK